MKEVSVNINVKSLLKGDIYEKEDGNTTEQKVKNVKLRVVVGTDTIYNQTVEASRTNITTSTKGTGSKEIKVYIDDVLVNNGTIKYSDMTSYTAE